MVPGNPSDTTLSSAVETDILEEESSAYEAFEIEVGSLTDFKDLLDVFEEIDTKHESEESLCSDSSVVGELLKTESGETLNEIKSLSLDIKLETGKTIYQVTELEIYIRTCNQLQIIPISDYDKQRILEVFDANYRSLGSDGVLALARALLMNSSVNELRLKGNNINGEGISHLISLMKENFFIANLDLSQNNVCSDGGEAISNLLKASQYIETLKLSYNEILEDHIKLIINGMKFNESLVELDLSHNYLSNNGGIIIGQFLAENRILKRLNLSWNEIYGKGAIELMRGLKNNKKLEILCLKWNGFEDELAPFIREVLATNRTLQEFDLSFNRITSNGTKLIVKGLAKNNTLKIFKMAYNPLDTAAALMILKAGWKSLKELDLKGVPVNTEFVKIVRNLRRKQEFEFSVKFGSAIKKIQHTKIGLKERNNDHPLEITRELLREKIDIRDILIHAQGIVNKETFLQLFKKTDYGLSEVFIKELYESLLREKNYVDIDELLSQLDMAEGDIEVKELKKDVQTQNPLKIKTKK